MTHAIDPILDGTGLRTRGHLPHLPQWVIPRSSLATKLDRGVCGLVTVVAAPPGWGKSLGVASWAANVRDPDSLTWLSAADAATDPDLFWESLNHALGEMGERHLASVPRLGTAASRRTRALGLLGRSLKPGRPRVLVLDDYPAGEVNVLGRDLEIVLTHAQRGLSVVLICHGDPAFPVQRHHVAGDLSRIGVPDLLMAWQEVAAVLDNHDRDARELTARTIERHTAGWPCGVRLAALALQDNRTIEAALAEADRATIDFMASEVLAKAPARARDVLVRTSMVADVGQDLVRAVLGPGAELEITPRVASDTFVELGRQQSFRCHPSLRAAAAAELAREPLNVRRQVLRRAAQWHLDHDQETTGIEIATAAQDWPWVGAALVEMYAVPQILADSVPKTVETALAVPSVRAAQPLIQAALLLRDGGWSAAEAVLALLREHPSSGVETDAEELSAIFVHLGVARGRGDLDSGGRLATRARTLMARLGAGPLRVLSPFLEAQVGALEASAGRLAAAEITLRRGATGTAGEDPAQAASLDCLGQLALLDAFRGNLRAADRQAVGVLKSSRRGPGRTAAHAHLATAWVHLERAEYVPARQHLDLAAEVGEAAAEPWYRTAQLLAEARLLVATDQPEAALRLLGLGMEAAAQEDRSGWSVALLTTESARALLATGEPRRALDLVVPGPAATPVLTRVLAARALVELGELTRAADAVAAAAPHLAGAPLGVQLEYWLLDAWLASDRGSIERARVLVDRALRESASEQLRRPFDAVSAWLLPMLDRDAPLRRAHSGFVARLRGPSGHPTRGPARTGQIIVETLTVREAQVLGLLAEMCSTEEIANELFLSVNTVKTYVRGILRKLSVNRRVDAVRRGRELGLC